ncbi:MAG: DinB family protein [Planctomycetota bacterium]|nr:MAG: DinB family protein [Planctomycetota bacterium]REJ92758.1 MAG: DinB family protein [Planctomycetota bacterium]REK23795.1 MAG: DinB family protein [Planctomycetota bacterium]REK47647.1 MAG: DinB family protein [Planctomycetota bacterium]
MNELTLALDQIKSAREYTLTLIEDLEPEQWFRTPAGGVTHIAWQVGHLAMAEFRLCLERLRGLEPEDRELISKDFLRMHSKGSVPVTDPADSPSVEELRATLDAVHERVLAEVPAYAGDDLNEPLINPHPIFTTKLEALFFCSKHEMLHAGQIGLLRRLLGMSPLR